MQNVIAMRKVLLKTYVTAEQELANANLGSMVTNVKVSSNQPPRVEINDLSSQLVHIHF